MSRVFIGAGIASVVLAIAACSCETVPPDTGAVRDLRSPEDTPVPDRPPPTCSDRTMNGGETDIDCGGATCGPCHASQACKVAKDCLSKICQDKYCRAASCSDQVQNGSESDVDCGGFTCPGCTDGQACTRASDCRGGACLAGKCATRPDAAVPDAAAPDAPPLVDKGPDKPQPHPDCCVSSPDGCPPQGPEFGMPPPSWDACLKLGTNLSGKVFVSPQVSCVPSDPSKDCQGTMYCAFHDKPYGVSKVSFHQSSSPNISHGVWYTVNYIPPKPAMYVECFMDDDGNASPAAPKPSPGDLHHHGYTTPIGPTYYCYGVRHCIVFDHRDP